MLNIQFPEDVERAELSRVALQRTFGVILEIAATLDAGADVGLPFQGLADILLPALEEVQTRVDYLTLILKRAGVFDTVERVQ